MITYELLGLFMVVGLLIGAALLLIAVIAEDVFSRKWPVLKASLPFRMALGFGMVVALPMVIALPNWLENPRLLTYFVPAACVGLLPFLPWWMGARARSRTNPSHTLKPAESTAPTRRRW